MSKRKRTAAEQVFAAVVGLAAGLGFWWLGWSVALPLSVLAAAELGAGLARLWD